MEGEAGEHKTGVFLESEALHADVERVVGQCAQADVGIEVADAEVGWIETSGREVGIELVVVQVGVTDDEGIDA